MSEENRRKSQRANFGVPPLRYGFGNTIRLPGETIHPSTSQENQGNVSHVSLNRTPSAKSKIPSEGSVNSRLQSIQARRIDVEMRLLQLELQKLAEEEKSIRQFNNSVEERSKRNSHPSQKTNSEVESIEDLEDICGTSQYNHSYVKNWLKNTEKEKEIVPNNENSEDISKTLVNCMKDLNINLEKIVMKQSVKPLQEFSGDISEFPYWLNDFERITAVNNISDADNLYRLQKCLKGKARERVKDLFCSPDNIGAIISTLKINFGREDWIIINQMEKVKRFASLKEDSIDSFIQFSNIVSNMVVSIKNIGSERYLENPDLLWKLEEKLPRNVKRSWAHEKVSKQRQSVIVNLEHFSDWLKSEVEMMMSVNIPHQISNIQENSTRKNVFHPNQSSAKQVLYHVTENVPQTCPLCNRDYHNLSKCDIFLSYNVEERTTFIQNNKYCFRCLRFGHLAKKCRSHIFCNIDSCRRKHHRLIHNNGSLSKENTSQMPEAENENSTHERVGLVQNKSSMLKIARVKLYNRDRWIETYALLDEGSTITLVDSDIAEEILLEGPKAPVCLQWANEISYNENSSMIVNFEISQPNSRTKKYKVKNARTVENLSLPEQHLDVDFIKSRYHYIDQALLESVKDAKPKLIIGQDNVSLIVSLEVIQPKYNQPAISKTRLGWVIHGPYFENSPIGLVNLCRHENDFLRQIIEDNFKIENSFFSNECIFSKDDERALEIFETSIERKGDRFQIGLPWKTENIIFPESEKAALSRLRCTERKMDSNPDFAKEYCDKIEEYVRKDYAEKVNERDLVDNGKVWYLPHFGVRNPNKPGKFRLVFDAAAKISGRSLNDFLLTGPDYYPLLIGILWRFRERKYAFCGDIKEMFHQVIIRKSDRKSQRFLFRGMDRDRDPDIFEMKVMIFGAVSSPSMAQFVKNFNANQYIEEFPDIMRIMLKQHYVDDYLDCADSIEEAVKTVHSVREVHRRGGFEMINWVSNSEEVLESIPIEARAQSKKLLNLDSKNVERILGLYWDVEKDMFTFTLRLDKLFPGIVSENKQSTKREMLKLVMTIFDPIGFLSPLVVKGRLILQECWSKNIDWDEAIPNEIQEKWQEWCMKVKDIKHFSIPRQYFTEQVQDVELHVFSDASDKAYSAVAYYRSSIFQKTSFVASKCKIGPLNKVLTIPRMELQGAVLAARLGSSIQKETTFNIIRNFWWTDSDIVLSWLKTKSCRLKQYEAHRISEIAEISPVQNWKWVPSQFNPADLATKDSNKTYIDKMWLEGPPFLRQPKNLWPPQKRESSLEIMNIISKTDTNDCMPDISRFSNWIRLIRTTAWMNRFIYNLKTRNGKKEGELSVEEIEEAENSWWKKIQKKHFSTEICCLEKKRPIEKDSPIHQLSPFLDVNGILRMDSRIKYSDLEYNTRFPIILPSGKKEHLILLLVKRYHELVHHTGQETVINNLRQRFWIIGLRQCVRTMINSCQYCKIKRAKPIQPEMSPLPEYRMKSYTRPFSFCGVDYFGPINVKVRRSLEKRYGVLFTCLNTRAIHLEIANSLTSDSALMAIRRMTARRGQPIELHSDNGTNFVGAENELKKCLMEMSQEKIKSSLSTQKIKWIFNTAAAPHMGGVWERMVKSVKKVLYIILKEHHPSEELLHTVLLEVESIVNTRPISYVSSNQEDLDALTPMHFLIGSANTDNITGVFKPGDVYGRKQWKIAQIMSNRFWQRWIKEFLPLLQKRSKWHQVSKSVRVGDVVAFPNSTLKNDWKLARIVKTFPGRDGQVRSVEVTTSKGNFIRPVNCLLWLEVGDCDG